MTPLYLLDCWYEIITKSFSLFFLVDNPKQIDTVTQFDVDSDKMRKRIVKKNGFFHCGECDYFSERKYTIVRHLERHGGLHYDCNFCDKKFKTHEHYKDHVRSCHPSEQAAKFSSKMILTETHFLSLEPRKGTGKRELKMDN